MKNKSDILYFKKNFDQNSWNLKAQKIISESFEWEVWLLPHIHNIHVFTGSNNDTFTLGYDNIQHD